MFSKTALLVFTLCFAILVDSLGWGVAMPLGTPLIIHNAIGLLPNGLSLGWRNFWFEATIAVYCFCMFFGSPILGGLSDQYGRKKVLLLSLAGCAVGFLICAFAISLKSFGLLLFGRCVSGSTAGSFAIAQAALIDMSDEQELPKRLGYMAIASGVGFAIGPVLAGFLLDPAFFPHKSYVMPFMLPAVMALVGFILMQAVFREKFSEEDNKKIDWFAGLKHIKTAFTFSKTKKLFTAFAFYMMSYSIFFGTLPLLLTERFHFSGSLVGYYLAFFAILFSISLIVLLPKVTKHISLTRIIVISLVMMIVLEVLFFLNHASVMLYVYGAVLSTAAPFIYVGLVTLISNNTERDQQGRAMGVVGSVVALIWGVGPLFIAFLASLSYVWAFPVAALSALIAVLTQIF